MPWTCENFTSPDRSVPEEVLYGYSLPALCLLGTFANILNIVVLADRRLVAPTYIYLVYLAIADLITLLLYFIDLISRMHFANQLWSHIYTAYIYLPIGSISTCSSLLLTVAVTVDRYVFILNPTAITSHSIPVSIQLETPRKRARKIGAIVCLVSAFINFPRMAAWYVDFETGCRKAREWAEDPNGWFSIYSYLRLLFLNIGSIIVLATFNILLILLVQESTSRRESRKSFLLFSKERNGELVKNSRRFSIKSRVFNRTNMSLTVTLIAATVLALAGEIPSTLFSRISATVIWNDPRTLDQEPYRYFVLTAYILIILEYSGNFVIYCLLNKRFRLVLSSKFGSATRKDDSVVANGGKLFAKRNNETRQRRSISLDYINQKHNNGNVAANGLLTHDGDRQHSSIIGENTENLVTEGGKAGENLSEFWRANEVVPKLDAAKNISQSYPSFNTHPQTEDNGLASDIF